MTESEVEAATESKPALKTFKLFRGPEDAHGELPREISAEQAGYDLRAGDFTFAIGDKVIAAFARNICSGYQEVQKVGEPEQAG